MARVDHIGIAVRDGEAASNLYRLLGFRLKGKEYVEEQELWAYFLEGEDGVRIELLEPTGGVVAKFIEKRGEGIHHIAVEVEDVTALTEELRRRGFRTVYEEPKRGAEGTLVNFIHPKSANGVLIEILEK